MAQRLSGDIGGAIGLADASPVGPSRLHAPAPLLLWRDIHLALAEMGETIVPEEMRAFAITRTAAEGDSQNGELAAAVAGEVVLEALHISHLWVREPFRSQGVGTELLAQAEAHGWMQGARRAHLETRSEAAKRFYLHQGYAVFGEMRRYLGEQSLYFMEKPL